MTQEGNSDYLPGRHDLRLQKAIGELAKQIVYYVESASAQRYDPKNPSHVAGYIANINAVTMSATSQVMQIILNSQHDTFTEMLRQKGEELEN